MFNTYKGIQYKVDLRFECEINAKATSILKCMKTIHIKKSDDARAR